MTKETVNKTILSVGAIGGLLLLTSSIVRVGACLYLPALPVIGKDLSISDAGMSLTMTAYFTIFSLFILISGPLSDAFGRKSLIVIGAIIFIIGSFVCGISNSLAYLLTGRIVQAIGASMIPGTCRAMIRDVGSDTQVVSLLGWMAVLGGLLMVGAPILGGIITEAYNWHYDFWLLVVFTFVTLLIISYFLPETLIKEKRIKLNLLPLLNTYKTMISSPKFFLVILPVALCYVIQGVYLATAPFIFIRSFNMTPTQFGLSNIAIVVALTIGRYLSLSMVKKYSNKTAYLSGAIIVLISGVIFTIIEINEYENIYTLLTGISFFGIGFGTLAPIGLKSSITAFRQTSGMAAALQGCLVLGGTAIGSAGIALMMKHSELSPMKILSISVAIIACLIFASVLSLKNQEI